MQWPVFYTTSPSPPSPVCHHHILGFLVSIIDRLAFDDGDAPIARHGESVVLPQEEAEEGAVVAGGGREAHGPHCQVRPWLLELRP
jgi:hypothetical protein